MPTQRRRTFTLTVAAVVTAVLFFGLVPFLLMTGRLT